MRLRSCEVGELLVLGQRNGLQALVLRSPPPLSLSLSLSLSLDWGYGSRGAFSILRCPQTRLAMRRIMSRRAASSQFGESVIAVVDLGMSLLRYKRTSVDVVRR